MKSIRRSHRRQIYGIANRVRLITLLGGRCVQCKTTKNLEFDHVNPLSKSFNVNDYLHGKFSTLLKEIGKCQLLCISCHGRKSANSRWRNM